jgi:hypothetical protein
MCNNTIAYAKYLQSDNSEYIFLNVLLPPTIQYTISKCQLLYYAHYLPHPLHIHYMLLHIRRHYCYCLNLAAYCHRHITSKRYMHLKTWKQKKQKKKMFTAETKLGRNVHCYSICKVLDFNQINFLPPSYYANSFTLGRNPTSTVTTARRITNG